MDSLPKPVEEDTETDNTPDSRVRYASLERVYSTTSRYVTAGVSSSAMSKKVKARKLSINDSNNGDEVKQPPKDSKPEIVKVYTRRIFKRPLSSIKPPVARGNQEEVVVKTENFELNGNSRDGESDGHKEKKRKGIRADESSKLEADKGILLALDAPRLRDCRKNSAKYNVTPRKKAKPKHKDVSVSASVKKWVSLSYDGVDPKSFIGLQCKVFWPMDADWYTGRVVQYKSEIKQHHVEYQDGDEEDLTLSSEKIKFHISHKEMEELSLKLNARTTDTDGHDFDEMLVLAANLDDCQEFEPGDIIWAKLTGHAMWPAIVVNESLIGERKGLNKILGGESILVQFFGTHDFARIKVKQAISFLKGLLSSYHQKCKQPSFVRSLEEAKMYLSEHKLPPKMYEQRNSNDVDCASISTEDVGSTNLGEDSIRNGEVWLESGGLGTCPYVIGDLRVLNLGKIVKDSACFKDAKSVWPEGYTAIRKFASLKDPNVLALYKMEVLRDPVSRSQPLFKVTADSGEEFIGATPSTCWINIYSRLSEIQSSTSSYPSLEGVRSHRSGSDMFGFSNPEVSKLIQGLLQLRPSSKLSTCKFSSGRYQDMPAGYRPVRVDWKDLDKCSVCHMDEEYENNLFLQCDKCRIMVHARCYGETEPIDGLLWLCNLCRPGAPDTTPPCSLCPVIGGAMKPTTDGRWAHLACAIWIPETCFSNVKKMEPIDGINRISKDRWKLMCSICGVAYGACIQCSNNTCRVAYHPLCARAAGLCIELVDEERLLVLSVDDDDTDQCIRFLSFCKKHKQPSNNSKETNKWTGSMGRRCSDYVPPVNPSGCARTEPYNHLGRRGRKEPEAIAAASMKRLFVENQPFLVGGFTQHELLGRQSYDGNSFPGLKGSQPDGPDNILSVSEKYTYMKETFRKRLAFGKSGIHGFGIFAKHPHKAGDMIIEYTGEVVRPSIADRRERFIYNSLVGAGTYMFRIDDERVIDATRAGSIAHLINHSCEPNCYSRVITVNNEKHIIIFSKRDIEKWEELTYDYRFFSIDEQLKCYCGFPRCRGIVNDEAEERANQLYAPRSELTDWIEE